MGVKNQRYSTYIVTAGKKNKLTRVLPKQGKGNQKITAGDSWVEGLNIFKEPHLLIEAKIIVFNIVFLGMRNDSYRLRGCVLDRSPMTRNF